MDKTKRMRVFSLYHPDISIQEVDIFVRNPIDFGEAYARKKLVKIGDLRIPLLSLDHLIALKKKAGRRQDLSDVEALKKLMKKAGRT